MLLVVKIINSDFLQNEKRKSSFFIRLLSIFYYFVAATVFFGTIHLPFPIFSLRVEGDFGIVLWVSHSVISFIIGYGLWALKLYGWYLVIGTNILFFFSITVYYFRVPLNDDMVNSTFVFIVLF